MLYKQQYSYKTSFNFTYKACVNITSKNTASGLSPR